MNTIEEQARRQSLLNKIHIARQMNYPKEEVEELQKAIMGDIQKSKPAGEIRDWGGKKYKKQPNGKWVEVSERRTVYEDKEKQKIYDRFVESGFNPEKAKRMIDSEYDSHKRTNEGATTKQLREAIISTYNVDGVER